MASRNHLLRRQPRRLCVGSCSYDPRYPACICVVWILVGVKRTRQLPSANHMPWSVQQDRQLLRCLVASCCLKMLRFRICTSSSALRREGPYNGVPFKGTMGSIIKSPFKGREVTGQGAKSICHVSIAISTEMATCGLRSLKGVHTGRCRV